jgi:hypothetical protein
VKRGCTSSYRYRSWHWHGRPCMHRPSSHPIRIHHIHPPLLTIVVRDVQTTYDLSDLLGLKHVHVSGENCWREKLNSFPAKTRGREPR